MIRTARRTWSDCRHEGLIADAAGALFFDSKEPNFTAAAAVLQPTAFAHRIEKGARNSPYPLVGKESIESIERGTTRQCPYPSVARAPQPLAANAPAR